MDRLKEFWKVCKKNKKLVILTAVLALVTYTVVYFCFIFDWGKVEEISYNEFLEYVAEDRIDTIYYSKSQEYMTITVLNDETSGMTKEERKDYKYKNEDKRKVLYPATDTFREDMLKKDINLTVLKDNKLFETFSSMFLILSVYAIFFLLMMKTMVPGGIFKEEEIIQTTDVTFDDVIGHEEILDDVRFITELIKDPTKGEKIGAKLPRGILFEGAPGTGKTLLAKAIAHEANVPFLYQNASNLIEMYVGLGAKRVRNLFKLARKKAPCIVFIDEIDAVGTSRGSEKSHSENDQTINALLQEMDGFDSRDGIFIIAATNRADTLDEALVRSGRFDRRIAVNPPRNWEVRRDLFKHYIEKLKTADDLDIDSIAKQTAGFTGADIAMVCNEASIVAIMHSKEAIDRACIEEAIDRKVFNGSRAKTDHYKEDKEVVAYHEAGHAVMTYLLGEPIARASILPTTSGVGGAVFREDSETQFETKQGLINFVMIAYAGRASEEIKYKAQYATTGASNDFTKATEVMLQYSGQYGFSEELGYLDIGVLLKAQLVDNTTITADLSEMSKKIYADCKERLEGNYDKVEKLAQKLLEAGTLDGAEIKAVIEG